MLIAVLCGMLSIVGAIADLNSNVTSRADDAKPTSKASVNTDHMDIDLNHINAPQPERRRKPSNSSRDSLESSISGQKVQNGRGDDIDDDDNGEEEKSNGEHIDETIYNCRAGKVTAQLWENRDWVEGIDGVTDLRTLENQEDATSCICACATDEDCDGFSMLGSTCILKRNVPMDFKPPIVRPPSGVVFHRMKKRPRTIGYAGMGTNIVGPPEIKYYCKERTIFVQVWENKEWVEGVDGVRSLGKLRRQEDEVNCLCSCAADPECNGISMVLIRYCYNNLIFLV